MIIYHPAPRMDSSPSLDIKALAAFNPALASQALAQLYSDGRAREAVDAAAEHGLDPFKPCELLRLAPQDPQPWSSAGALSLSAASRKWPLKTAGLVDLIIQARDQASLDRLLRVPGIGERLFGQSFQHVCSAIAEILPERPEFAFHLFERLDPPPADPQIRRAGHSYSANTGFNAMVEAACAARRVEWIPRLRALALASGLEGLDGAGLSSKFFQSPPCPEGAEALLALDPQRSDARWRVVGRAFLNSESEAARDAGSRILRSVFDQVLASGHLAASGSAFNQSYCHEMLDHTPHRTSARVVEFYLKFGLAPFDARERCVNLGQKFLDSAWRREALGALEPGMSRQEAAQRARAAHEDQILPLLALLTRHADPESAGAHLELSGFSQDVRDRFRGARKVDLLCVCVAQGHYRCAQALIDFGVDWTFAAKQCAQWLRPDSLDPSDAKGLALAYFDALALRKVSLGATGRRDARLAREEAPAPAPAPVRRL